MSLLTPSESHGHFQHLVDYHQHDQNRQHIHPHHHPYERQPQPVLSSHHHTVASAAEWPMYSPTDSHPTQSNNDALSRATKDLMSLEVDTWNPNPTNNNQQQIQSSRPHYNVNYSYHPPPQPRRNVTFPFLAKPLSITPYNSDGTPSLQTPSTASSSSTSGSSYSYHHPMPTSPTQPIRSSRSPKRSLDASAQILEAKRQRPSLSHTLSLPHHNPSSYSRLPASPVLPSLLPTVVPSSSKPALLSPSQKKANHIQSEQKRRANIRRGYEALCDTVPALREAIRAEDEATTVGKDARGVRAKRSRTRSAKGEDTQLPGDKIDGRAGPRSENVVLLKTIDYINELVSERTDLLARLDNARNALPPNHPALQQSSSSTRSALWEREWKGGEPKQEEDEEEDED